MLNTFQSLLETFSTDPNQRGKQFEILCRWYLRTHPHYSHSYKKVWLWDDWPGRWGPDCGIDLIAEDFDGKFHAIQAKCYSEDNTVTKKDIDSFLSESTDLGKIHYRLLIATTNHIAKNARSVIDRQNKSIPINLILLNDLVTASITWPDSIQNLGSGGEKPKYLPRPHQVAAIQDVVEKLDKRGQLIMACGTGKTLTALWISERLKAESILVVLPSLLLLSKTLSDWLVHSKDKFSYLPVCSDESVDKKNDSINFSTYELGYPSTTDPDSIREFLHKSGKKIIFSTYQSSQKIVDAMCSADLKFFDLMICDEAHRCAGKADSIYATVIIDEMIPSKQRLFMTATPRIYKSHIVKKASETGVDILSMDDEKSFGEVLHKLSFSDAINNNPPLLSDYQVVIIGVDHTTYAEMIDERTLVKTETDIQSNAQSLASHIGLLKSIKNYNLNRVITFHSRVKYAKQFSEDLSDVIDWIPIENRPPGDCKTNYVSGDMPIHQRAIKLQSLSDVDEPDTHVLSNARCLSEGVDVPALDGVAFIDPKNSEIDIIQAVGRAIRLSSNKVKGTIIIPVFVDSNEDVETNLQSSAFKKIWAVVNALRSHDDEFGENLDEIRRGLGRKASQTYKLDKIIFDLPTLITKDFEKALTTKIVETATASWEFWFGMLIDYKQSKGHLRVPQGYKHGESKLGSWVGDQRKYYKKGILSPERIKELEVLGFDWDPFETSFQEGITALKQYKQYRQSEGHLRIPENYKHGEFNLGKWVQHRRQEYKKGTLSPERIKELEGLGFDWDPSESSYKEAIAALKDYKQLEGHLRVPAKYKYGEFNLGGWVGERRKAYRKGILSSERIKELEGLGFDWDPKESSYQEGITVLKEYKQSEGHLSVPNRYKHGEFNLGKWVTSRRKEYKKGTLSPERIKELEGLGINWVIENNEKNKKKEN